MSVPSFIRIERGSDRGPRLQTLQCAFFARKPVNFNVLLSAAPTLALLSASRYYCDVNWSNHNVCAKFH